MIGLFFAMYLYQYGFVAHLESYASLRGRGAMLVVLR
jgi:hypothetical protein